MTTNVFSSNIYAKCQVCIQEIMCNEFSLVISMISEYSIFSW